MTTPRFMIILLMIGILGFSSGCDDAEEALNGIPDPGDDPAVQLVAAEGVEMAKSLLATLPEVAGGAIGSKSIDEAYYDEGTGSWYWSITEGNENTNPYWLRSSNFQGTFYNGETAQRDFAGADRLVLVVTFYYEWSEFHEDTYSSKSVNINANLEATGMGVVGTKATVTTEGTGTGYVSGGTGNYTDEEWDGFYEEFDVDVGITLPVPGCPTGGIDLFTEEATMHMGFNGTSTGSWSYKFGDTTLDSGNFPISCGGM